MNRKKRDRVVGIYIRTSTVDYEKYAHGQQLFDCWKYICANLKDVRRVCAYSDLGFSSRDPHPALQQLIRDAKRGKIDTVVTVNANRIARSVPKALGVLKGLESNGSDVRVVLGKCTRSSLGKLRRQEPFAGQL